MSSKPYYYKVADCLFSLTLPDVRPMDELLPSFQPFSCQPDAGEQVLFAVTAGGELSLASGVPHWTERQENLFGHMEMSRFDSEYRCHVSFSEQGKRHVLVSSLDFTENRVFLDWEDTYVGKVLSAMLCLVFAQAGLMRGAVCFHASVVESGGLGYLFLGKSGTGKSTHSSLWLKRVPDVRLLNDDNPVVRLQEGRVEVYGTPWSGKTPCYRNASCPVGGFVRIVQASENRFRLVADSQAFVQLLPSCSVILRDKRLHGALCDTLVGMVEAVKVGVLECLPDVSAVDCCRKGLGLD